MYVIYIFDLFMYCTMHHALNCISLRKADHQHAGADSGAVLSNAAENIPLIDALPD